MPLQFIHHQKSNNAFVHIVIQYSTLSINNIVKMDMSQLTPQQKQAIMMRAQQEANQKIMQAMMEKMVKTCFDKCAGTSVSDYRLQFAVCTFNTSLAGCSIVMQRYVTPCRVQSKVPLSLFFFHIQMRLFTLVTALCLILSHSHSTTK